MLQTYSVTLQREHSACCMNCQVHIVLYRENKPSAILLHQQPMHMTQGFRRSLI